MKEKNLLLQEQILFFKIWSYLSCSPFQNGGREADFYYNRIISLGGVHIQLSLRIACFNKILGLSTPLMISSKVVADMTSTGRQESLNSNSMKMSFILFCFVKNGWFVIPDHQASSRLVARYAVHETVRESWPSQRNFGES